MLGWAALVLPPRWNTLLGLICAGLALLHAVTAASVLSAPVLGHRALRVLAWASLASALIFAGALGGASVELVRMFGALGWGLTALLGAILLLLLALTVPIGVAGLWLTRAPHAAS